MAQVYGTKEVSYGVIPDPGPSDTATAQARAALARRMAGGPNNKFLVMGHAPISDDVYAANPNLVLGNAASDQTGK
jgi:hypothetical protein